VSYAAIMLDQPAPLPRIWTGAWVSGTTVRAVREWPICPSPPRVGPAWLTNGIRIELHHQGILAVAVHASVIDATWPLWSTRPKTARSRSLGRPSTPSRPGEIEVLADERSRFVKASLSRDHELIYPPVQFWDAALKGTQ
jgi:hypothetical protein